MTTKTADAATAAVSFQSANETQSARGAGQEQGLAKQDAGGSLEQGAGAVVNLSPELRDQLTRELQQTLHAIETGFDTLTKPTDIANAGATFHVIDGVVIDDYVDKRTGEQTSKVVFRLQYEDGRVVNVMQSAARPRRLIARACEQANGLGYKFKAGPYKYIKKGVGQIQDAIIMEQQSGWRQEVY